MTENDFPIIHLMPHLMLFFIACHYWLRVYNRITNDLFSLYNEFKQLHSHKQYRQTAPLRAY